VTNNGKTVPIPKVYPLTRETVQEITGDPCSSVSRAAISNCLVCGSIPESTGMGGTARHAESMSRLAEKVEIHASLRLLKCPLCGCFYALKGHAGPEEGGGEGGTLIRMQPSEAFELLLKQKAKAIRREGDRWLLAW